MLLLLADLAVATAAAGGLVLLLTSLTFASHAWFASVPQRPPAAGTRALRADEDPTGALFTFMLKGYGLALIVTHVHAWCDGPLATQHGQSAALAHAHATHPLLPHAHAPARGYPPGSRGEASSLEYRTVAAATLCAERAFLACRPPTRSHCCWSC